MGLTANTYNFPAGFNIKAAQPIDSRTVVSSENDLISDATWKKDGAWVYPLFNGLQVTVLDTGDIWTLKNTNYYTDKISGNGWHKAGASAEDIIDDNVISGSTTWSSLKVDDSISKKQDLVEVSVQEVLDFLNEEDN